MHTSSQTTTTTRQTIIQSHLTNTVDSDSISTASKWLEAAHLKKVVVVIGAGMTSNAKKQGEVSIPNWETVTESFREQIGLSSLSIDNLLLADLCRNDPKSEKEYVDRLLKLLDDGSISPGISHDTLFDLRGLAGVITLNQLDTLLD